MLDNFEQVLEAAPMLAELLAGAPGLRSSSPAARRSTSPRSGSTRCPRSSFPTGLARSRSTVSGGQRRYGCSSTAHASRGPTSSSPSETPTRSPSSASVWTGCRSRSSSPPRGSSCSRRATILERLGGRLELLKAAPGAGLPDRHRTLRAAIEWSYDLLARGGAGAVHEPRRLRRRLHARRCRRRRRQTSSSTSSTASSRC